MSTRKGPINSLLYQSTVPQCLAVAVWHQTSILALIEASWLCCLSRNAEFEQHVDFKGVVLKFRPKLGNTFLLVTGQFLACSIVIRSACLCSISDQLRAIFTGFRKVLCFPVCCSTSFFSSPRGAMMWRGKKGSNWGQVSQ